MFGRVTVGMADNPSKKYLFVLDERVALFRAGLVEVGIDPAVVEIAVVDGLTCDWARVYGYTHLIKGARAAQDFDYERLLHEISQTQQTGIETVLLFAKPAYSVVSSSGAKELVKLYGDTRGMLTHGVRRAIEAKLGRRIIAVTGAIGAGKSTFCREAVALLRGRGVDVHHVDMDAVAHRLIDGDFPLAQEVRLRVAATFGTTDRKALGQIVFGDSANLNRLNEIYKDPMLTLIRRELANKRGIIFLEGALLAEFGWLYLAAGEVVMVVAAEQDVLRRLEGRGLTPDQIDRRLNSQWDATRKAEALQQGIREGEIARALVLAAVKPGRYADLSLVEAGRKTFPEPDFKDESLDAVLSRLIAPARSI
jgi:pantetheine-phosphate adenylyltransferase